MLFHRLSVGIFFFHFSYRRATLSTNMFEWARKYVKLFPMWKTYGRHRYLQWQPEHANLFFDNVFSTWLTWRWAHTKLCYKFSPYFAVNANKRTINWNRNSSAVSVQNSNEWANVRSNLYVYVDFYFVLKYDRIFWQWNTLDVVFLHFTRSKVPENKQFENEFCHLLCQRWRSPHHSEHHSWSMKCEYSLDGVE